MSDEEHDNDARGGFVVVQDMIDVSADRLEGLRTQCATSAELIQQEIRTLEGKLIKLFSRQLVTKAKLKKERSLPSDMKHTPSLTQWLQVVGLSDDSIQAVCKKVSSLEALHDKSEHELKKMLIKKNAKEEEIRRLSRALHNLRRYTDVLLRGDKREPSELYWDSWDRHNLLKSTSPRPQRNHITRKSVPSSEEVLNVNGNGKDSSNQMSQESLSHLAQQNCLGSSPSVSSRNTLSNSYQSLRSFPNESLQNINKNAHYENNLLINSQGLIYNCSHSEKNLALTPSESLSSIQAGVSPSEDAIADQQTNSDPIDKNKTAQTSNQNLVPDASTLLKSKSHESQLGSKRNNSESTSDDAPEKQSGASNTSTLSTEPKSDESSAPSPSPLKSPRGSTSTDTEETNRGSTTVIPVQPRSPRNPIVSRGMGHMIQHRFTKTFKMMSSCDFCEKQMFIGTGLSCKECKFRCHKECGPKVPPSCGLPQGFVDEFKKLFQPDGFHPGSSPSRGSPGHLLPSALLRRDRQKSHPQANSNSITPFQGPDSSSNTSSCNSSAPSSPALQTQNVPPTPHQTTKAQFNFPEVSLDKGITLETHPLNMKPGISELVDTRQSNDSDKTVSLSGSNSTDSERTPVRVDSVDGETASGELRWPRQNSLSMREWDIPYDELHLSDVIGKGRFGTVHRGNWHGDVAIKVLDTTFDYVNEKKSLDAFKLEVSTFRKTRHENVVLFMGACMKPPHLAIVTALCKGMTLYTHIHLRKDKFNMNRTTLVAQQIAQGMGYLHARGIVHKDLKSKNIFLENGKVVITDFGLFSVTKLCYGNSKNDSLGIPTGWLCYLAPEVIRSLRAHQKCHEKELPFTQASDVYAFGTVWYELLCGEWPFKGQPPEAIIWQVGRGMKQTLANLQASRDVKDILMHCWSYHCENRPDFTQLLNTLEKLPKKRLARSPSHPVHLSRSAESVF